MVSKYFYSVINMHILGLSFFILFYVIIYLVIFAGCYKFFKVCWYLFQVFYSLFQLRRLSLSDNQISRLAPDISNLVKLQEFDISHNGKFSF